jgi:exonuclease VII small subunit
MELSRICQQVLDEAEQRIQVLMEKEGTLVVKPFEGSE